MHTTLTPHWYLVCAKTEHIAWTKTSCTDVLDTSAALNSYHNQSYSKSVVYCFAGATSVVPRWPPCKHIVREKTEAISVPEQVRDKTEGKNLPVEGDPLGFCFCISADLTVPSNTRFRHLYCFSSEEQG